MSQHRYASNLLAKIAAFVLAYGLASMASHASAESLAGYEVLSWDYDNDGDTDVLVRRQTKATELYIPYQIVVSANVPANGDYYLLQAASGNAGYTLAVIDAIVAADSRWQAQPKLEGQFSPDDLADLVIYPPVPGKSGVLLVATRTGDPLLQHIFSTSDIGLDLADTSLQKRLYDQDVFNDRMHEILVDGATGKSWLIYVDQNGHLTRALPYPPKFVNGERDSDGDGIADSRDNFRFDPSRSGDIDLDGIADEDDADRDGDGIDNTQDNEPSDANNGQAVGAIDGHFEVTAAGKAQYSIALEAPPSPGNILPALSLAYHHGSGDGPVGYGFNIEGLSEISRCATTLAQDNFINGVNFNSSDRFCLNGQRLVLISGTAYGAANSVYRTENDTFTKIVAVGGSGNQPATFTVYYAGGETETYGKTTDANNNALNSTQKQQNATNKIYKWLISDRTDRQGNTVSYSYINNLDTGEVYIDTIRYGADTTLNNRIVFKYEARSDWRSAYNDNVITSTRQRLGRVLTYQPLDGQPYREYVLTYRYSSQLGRSILDTLNVCSYKASKTCLRPTTFQWNEAQSGEFELDYQGREADSSINAQSKSNNQYLLADVTGDGRADSLWVYGDGDVLHWEVYASQRDANGFSGFQKVASGSDNGYRASLPAQADQRFLAGDINGDGQADLIWVARHGDTLYRTIYLWNGTNFVSQGYEADAQTDYLAAETVNVTLLDINGDQRQDLLWLYKNTSQNTLKAVIFHSTGAALPRVAQQVLAGTGAAKAGYTPNAYTQQRLLTGDINGDGKHDLAWAFEHQYRLYRAVFLANANGTQFDAISLCGRTDCSKTGTNALSTTTADTHQDIALNDINGDGKADLLWSFMRDGNVQAITLLADQSGTRFALASHLINASIPEHLVGNSALVDINGDDRADWVYSYQQSGQFSWYVALANARGTGFTPYTNDSINVVAGAQNPNYQFADFTGDGKADFLYAFNRSSHERHVFTQTEGYPDHIGHIDNGMGRSYDIEYDYLAGADADFYQRGSAVSYPLRSDAGLSYVVRRVLQGNGVGGNNETRYRYKGAVTHLQGRGFLGFAQQTVIDTARGVRTDTDYLQAFPYTGVAARQLTSLTNSAGDPLRLIDSSYFHWASVATSGTAQFRYLVDEATQTFDVTSGNSMQATLVRYESYDIYGNLLQKTSQTGTALNSARTDVFNATASSNFFAANDLSNVAQTITQVNVYTNTDSNWRLGFRTNETLTYSVPGQTTRTVKNRFVARSTSSHQVSNQYSYDTHASLQLTRSFNYDNFGNPTSIASTGVVGGYRNESVDKYELGLYPKTRTNALNQKESFAYDPFTGALERHADANGQVTYTYTNGFSQPTLTARPDGSQLRYDYSYCDSSCPQYAQYRVTETTTHPQESGQGAPQTVRYFDAFDREVATRQKHASGQYRWQRRAYDALGRVSYESQPHLAGSGGTAIFHRTDFLYDVRDRVTQESRADGGSTAIAYGSNGTGERNVVTTQVVDPINGNRQMTTILQKDVAGRLLQVLDPVSSVAYGYDAQGFLSQVTVNNDANTTINITNDEAGNRTLVDDPDAGIIKYTWNSFGELHQQQYDPAGVNHRFVNTLDALGRTTKRVYYTPSQSRVIDWAWDTRPNGIGKVGTATVNTSQYKEELFYDGIGRLSGRLVTNPGVEVAEFGYLYDGFSREKRVRYPDGFGVRYEYFQSGERSRIVDAANNTIYWQASAYDAFGNATAATLGNGLQTHNDYNPASGRITDLMVGTAQQPASLADYHFVHDSAGNLVERSNAVIGTGVSEHFSYDNAHRLRTAYTTGLPSGASRSLTFDYDALGNLRTKSDVSNASGMQYGLGNHGPHQLSRIDSTSGSITYNYDARGNVTQRGADVLAYDLDNKPTSISHGFAQTSFIYGQDGQRIKQTTNPNIAQGFPNTETWYFGDGYEVVADGANVRIKAQVDDVFVHQTVLNLTTRSRTEAVQYVHGDHLGSTDVVTDNTGQALTRMAFEPFGARRDGQWRKADASYLASLKATTFETTTAGFTGHEQLDAVELIHMNGRVYDPVAGRFLSADLFVQFPENSQSYNRYSYVMNNPLSYDDPSGHIIPLLIAGGVMAYRAYSAYDTVTTAIEDVGVIADDQASTEERIFAAVSLTASVATGTVGKKAVGIFKAAKTEAKAVRAAEKKVASKVSKKGAGTDKNTEVEAVAKAEERTADVEKAGPDFIVSRNGTATHASQSKLKESLLDAGAKSKGKTSQTSEIGERFEIETAHGPMEIRIMPGKLGQGRDKGLRTVTTRPETDDYVHPNGERIKGNLSKAERRAVGHTHEQRP